MKLNDKELLKEMYKHRDSYEYIGKSTEPTNKLVAEESIAELYRIADIKRPKFIWCRSPFEITRLVNIINNFDQLDKNDKKEVEKQVNKAMDTQTHVDCELIKELAFKIKDKKIVEFDLYGQFDAYFVCYFRFIQKYLGVPNLANEVVSNNNERLDLYESIVHSCGPAVMFDDYCFVSEKAEIVSVDENNQLHSEVGPTLKYSDNTRIYNWHGREVPEKWIIDKENMSAEEILKTPNVELRRCGCEIFGWANILNKLDKETIDVDEDQQIGELVSVQLPDIEERELFLLVLCGTGREFAIPVPPDMKTARQANAWTYGFEENEFNIEVRT